MSDFLKGNPLIMPNYFLGDVPMDTKTKASSVSEVLTVLAKENRYTGLTIYCELEEEFYCFKTGIEDSDFIKTGGSTSLIKVANFASLPTINQDSTAIYIALDTMIEYIWNVNIWSTFKNIADNISFNNSPNGTNIYPTDYQTVQKVLEQNKKEVDLKVDKIDVVTVATPNKILKLDENSKLPTSITGDSDTIDGKHVDDTKTGIDATTNNALWTANKVKNYVDTQDNLKQNIIENTLTTTTKTIPLAINEVNTVITNHKSDTNNPHLTTKSQVGLGNVDNIQQIPINQKGVANGVATLDSSGLVPSIQLPSYVDDVLEFMNLASFPTTGETGKIYVDKTTNKTYRWSGSVYTYITSGAVDSVNGKTGVVALTKADFSDLNLVDNIADANKNVLSATKLTTTRAISYTGDVIGSNTFNGSVDVTTPMTLANSGVTVGTYTKVTVDSKGRTTSGTNLIATDIPILTSSKISDFDTQVRTSTLNQMASPTVDLSINNKKIVNVANPTLSTDAVNKSYSDTQDALKQNITENTLTTINKTIPTAINEVNTTLNLKVDKVTGKSLVLDTEITKLATIANGAEVNVQADWNNTVITDDSYIKNKPDLDLYQTRIDDSLPTANKNVVGSIGEVCLSMTLQGLKPLYETHPFGNSTSVTQSQIQSWFDNNAYLINFESYDTINPSTDCNVSIGCDEGYVLWLGSNTWYYSLNNGSGDYWSNMTPMASKGDFTLGEITMIAMGKKFIPTKADLTHSHVKSDITDFAHTHVKSDISNFSHTHTKSDITNFTHTHLKADITDLTNVTQSANGLMIPTDKTKLDNIYSLSSSSRDFKTAYSASGVYRMANPLSNIPPGYEQVYGDFWVDVKYLDANNQNLTVYDIKSSAIWRLSCVAGTWSEWSRLDYGTSASSDKINSPDTRGVSGYSLPSDYISKGKGVMYEFKNITNIALSPTTFPVIGTMSFCQVETKIPWNDSSGGGYPTQTATCSGYVFTRTGTSGSTWGNWTQFMTVPASVDYVIETWRSGTEWRRTYNSGWVEQGGYVTIKSDSSTVITLPITMADVNYSIMTSVNCTNSTGGSSDASYYGSVTTTGFTLYSDYASNS